ncbi:MAG: TSUP family transporter [Promethearchaeota archaeon]
MELIILIILIAFIFEMMDSLAGMGFGTALTPLLLLLGYSPLQVIPTLLISEALTGAIDAFFDHEFKNVRFSFHPTNDATKLSILIASFGCLAIVISVFLGYYVLRFPDFLIKMYVAILVLFMGIFAIVRIFIKNLNRNKRNVRLIIIFSTIAGFNKGIGGGGYGPVIMMGQLFSGIYEKSATAIVSLAESIVSFMGIITFIFISSIGVEIDFILLPSIFTGGFLASILAPYLTRVLPNEIWRYFIPFYAIGIGTYLILQLFCF